MSDTEIGFTVACYSLALFSSSFIFGRAADRCGRKPFLVIGLILSATVFFLQIFANDFLVLLMVRALVGFCSGIYPASLIAYVHENKEDLSKFSSFGFLGWALGSLIAGSIAVYFTVKGVFIFSSLLCFLAFFTALRMRFVEHSSMDVPKLPIEIAKKNLSLYLSILIRHSGAQMIWTFWPLFLGSLGADFFWIGVIQMINFTTQFLFTYTLSSRLEYGSSIMAGLILSGIAFFSFTLATDFWQIIPTQILLGVSWALMYVGGLRYLLDTNIEKATVSGLFGSVLSLSSIAGPFMATFMVAFSSYRATMYLASILALISSLSFKLLKQSHSRKLSTSC
jgi:DHA1 family quinolone resistance protein-like MFS transporter